MYYVRKLKPNNFIWSAIIPFIFLLAAALTWILVGLRPAMYLLGGLLGLYSLYSLLILIRTRNPAYLAVFLFNLFEAITAASVPNGLKGGTGRQIMLVSLAVMYFLLIVVIFLNASRRLKWRGSELFELAGLAVEETGDGYTARPRPAGKTEFTREDLLSFANFAARHQIGMAYVEQQRVVFVPVVSGSEFAFILGLKDRYQSESYIAFENDGHVSVQITQRDYLNYQEDLDFDQLCQALGDLFVEFIGLFKAGKGVRILDRMNALKLPYFS